MEFRRAFNCFHIIDVFAILMVFPFLFVLLFIVRNIAEKCSVLSKKCFLQQARIFALAVVHPFLNARCLARGFTVAVIAMPGGRRPIIEHFTIINIILCPLFYYMPRNFKLVDLRQL